MYDYHATLLHVVDADTVDVDLDLGLLGIDAKQRVRLHGVDAPERHTDQGKAATKFVEDWFKKHPHFTVKHYISDDKDREKYGRVLAVIRPPSGPDLSAALIAAGHGVAYFGGHKEVPHAS